ncbi:hypothetical protein [Sediminibacillus massiliensis]|uniref:hypothetical protein n=1 Tax=Sediminibacillus massiliensis TaxID=1926277 RepID=UPI0009885434|nr:hypothetical protein [Sediminibacillus massiliensis]
MDTGRIIDELNRWIIRNKDCRPQGKLDDYITLKDAELLVRECKEIENKNEKMLKHFREIHDTIEDDSLSDEEKIQSIIMKNVHFLILN